MLNNKQPGAHFSNIDLNLHTDAHLYRATQEGISFAFRYGLDIMRENGLHPTVVKAGKANMFLSKVFAASFANSTGLVTNLYNTDGSIGAALGAGLGAGIFKNTEEAMANIQCIETIEPKGQQSFYDELYYQWKFNLEQLLATS